MATSLLQKEEEYRKLNEELQHQNKKLMEEFDSVMKKQDDLLKETVKGTKSDYVKLICRKSDEANFIIPNKSNKTAGSVPPSQEKYFGPAMKENCENLQDDKIHLSCIPDSVDQMGIKGMSHFYRAKVKAMQNDYDKLQFEFKNKLRTHLLTKC